MWMSLQYCGFHKLAPRGKKKKKKSIICTFRKLNEYTESPHKNFKNEVLSECCDMSTTKVKHQQKEVFSRKKWTIICLTHDKIQQLKSDTVWEISTEKLFISYLCVSV